MKIRIYRPHTHAGKHYTPGPDGIELDVKPHHAKQMRELKVDVKPDAAPETKPESAARSPVDSYQPQA